MTQGSGQQKGLETLKLINAASTALRLYPGGSTQVTEAFESAYQGVKLFVRKNRMLRFSLLNGSYWLNGEPADNPTRERLELLSFSDQLRKLEFNELVFYKGIDRARFKKILSVLSATPDQVQAAGGSWEFVEQLGLGDVFPKEYSSPGEIEEERKKKGIVDKRLRELSGGEVRAEFILSLIGRCGDEKITMALRHSFQSSEKGGRIVAASIYSLIQILNKEHGITVAPVVSKIFENVSNYLAKGQYREVSTKASIRLIPQLDELSVLKLLCQDFSSPFGECFYDALLAATGLDTLASVLSRMNDLQEEGATGNEKLEKQLRVVSTGAEKLLATSRGKRILARNTTKEKIRKTEVSREEKKVQAALKSLAKGDLSSLKNEEMCRHLPSTIEKLLKNEKEPVAAVILQNMVKALAERGHGNRRRLAQVLGGIAYKLVQMERWLWLERLTPVCLAWIRENEIADQSFEMHVQAMQATMNHAWRVDNIELAEYILNVFYHIRSGAMEKNDAVCQVIGQIQDENVGFALLQNYLDRCFETPVDEMICRKIIMQGPVAARFLLDTLITSDRRSHRIRLLKILSELGEDLVPVLLERLPDAMPWFGKRNIIRLLAETGAEENVEAVLGYISHEDLRVQQEALECVVQNGAGSLEKYLLQILPVASGQLKILILKHLRRVATKGAVVPLGALLEECKLYHGPEKEGLSLEVIRVLGGIGSKKALPVLKKVTDDDETRFGQKSVEAAQLAMFRIQEKKKRVKKDFPESAMSNEIVENDSSADTYGYGVITGYPEEKEIYRLLQQGEKKSATQLLVRLVEKTASLGEINDAELLRMRLLEVDSMALSEIIKTAELIEEAKTNSVDKDHILIWSDLYDLLSTEEFNAFYHALEHETYASEVVIVKQGEPQWRLCFVNKGRVKLCYNEKENETLVKTLKQGNVFGGTSFFDDSVWTLNAIAMGTVEMSTLSIDRVGEWGEAFPALEAKLQEYCRRFDRVNEFFISTGAERRAGERRPFRGNVHLALLAGQGVATELSIRGECSDLSVGGISCASRISNREQARTLLGRQVELFFESDAKSGEVKHRNGTVVAVRNLYSADSSRSVHIQFDTALKPNEMLDIENGQ